MSDESKQADQDKRHHGGDVAFIQALAELLDRNDLTELTVKREYDENDRLTVSLSKQSKQVVQAYAPAPVMAAVPAAGAPAAAAPAAAAGFPADAAAEPECEPAGLPAPVHAAAVRFATVQPADRSVDLGHRDSGGSAAQPEPGQPGNWPVLQPVVPRWSLPRP